MAVICHADSWVEPQHLGKSQPYRPTHTDSLSIGPTHRRLLQAPLKPNSVCIDVGIPGSLRREDAAKLYELAHFGSGDVVVFGLGHGLSAAIIAQAISDSNRNGVVIGVDSESRAVIRAQGNLAAFNFDEIVSFVHKAPLDFCKVTVADGRMFGFAFVDHSTDYTNVVALCKFMPQLIANSGFILFHDFNDRRNRDTMSGGYGVYSGVADGLPTPPFSFCGVFGCTGLFRKDEM